MFFYVLINHLAHHSQYMIPEAHGQQRSPECTAIKAIFSQNTVNVACKKISLSFAMATIQIQKFGLNSYGWYRTTPETFL